MGSGFLTEKGVRSSVTTPDRQFARRLVPFISLCLFALTAVASASQAAGDSVDVATIIDKVDKLYRSETSYTEIEMTITNPNWERTVGVNMWTKGMDETFISITAPKRDAGITTLRKGREMWNYFPKIDKLMKVPPSMMMGSWMGSDFTNDDLVKESTFHDDYESRLIPPSERTIEPDASQTYAIELIPKEKTATVWGRIVLVVRRHDFIPLREAYYDERGRMMRRMDFFDVAELGGRPIPTRFELVPLNKEGHRTTIRYVAAEFEVEHDSQVFTQRNMRRLR